MCLLTSAGKDSFLKATGASCVFIIQIFFRILKPALLFAAVLTEDPDLSILAGRFKKLHGFFRLHRSYLISLEQVSVLTKKEVELTNQIRLPIPRGKWETLNRAYLNHFRSKAAGDGFPRL